MQCIAFSFCFSFYKHTMFFCFFIDGFQIDRVKVLLSLNGANCQICTSRISQNLKHPERAVPVLLQPKQQYHKICSICFCSADTQANTAEPILEEDEHHSAIAIYILHKANLKTPRIFFLTNWIELYKLDWIEDKLNWFYGRLDEGAVKHIPIHTVQYDDCPY